MRKKRMIRKYYCGLCVHFWVKKGIGNRPLQCHGGCKRYIDPLPKGSPIEKRQFHCPTCTRTWWRPWPVEEHNQKVVRACRTCNEQYDPVPRGEELGTCRCMFECACGHEYTSLCRRKATARCFKCDRQVKSHACDRPRFVCGYSGNGHECEDCKGNAAECAALKALDQQKISAERRNKKG